jgi:hypothetical protein
MTQPGPPATTDRAQAHTLEAFTAAFLLMGGLTLGVTVVTPNLDTSSGHVENEREVMAGGLLDAAAENGSLRAALLDWNDSAGGFAGAGDRGYHRYPGRANNTFGAMLGRTVLDRGVGVNVNVGYMTESGTLRTRRMVYFGTPGDHAVSVSRDVTLYDDDTLDGGPALRNATSYFAPDTSGGNIHTVVRVEVTVWRR